MQVQSNYGYSTLFARFVLGQHHPAIISNERANVKKNTLKSMPTISRVSASLFHCCEAFFNPRPSIGCRATNTPKTVFRSGQNPDECHFVLLITD